MGSGSLDSDGKGKRNGGRGQGAQNISLGAQGSPGKGDTNVSIKMGKAQAKLLNLYLAFLACRRGHRLGTPMPVLERTHNHAILWRCL